MLKNSDIQLFPKVELHCHLDGSIRPITLQKIAKLQGLVIDENMDSISKKMQAPSNCQNLSDYLACFDFVLPYLQTKEALEMAAFDVMEQASEDGVRYIEIRFAPILSMEKGLSVEETIQAVANGIAKAEAKYPVFGNLLVIGMKSGDLDRVSSVFSEAHQLNHKKVVGFDLAGEEKDHFIKEYQEVLKVVTDLGNIPLTLHAGECGCAHNIFQAVEVGAKRIGHGIALKGDVAAQKEFSQLNACIEGCPTSNIQTKAIETIKDYPLREWLENKVTFCISTDNRTVSDTTLTKEYRLLSENFDLTREELRQLNHNGMMYSFADMSLKNQVIAEISCFKFN